MLDKSLNLARRLSARIEPDFLQDSILEDYTDEDHDLLTKKYCETLARKLSSRVDMLPNGCKQFDTVSLMINRHDTKRHDDAIAFEGMHTGEALAAMAARERGHLPPAQIQRRFTNSSKTNKVWRK
eukprot:278439_1